MKTLIDGALDKFLAEDDGRPIVMLNLLRFAPDGGRERYFQYIAMVGPLVERYGAQIAYAGDGLDPLVAEPRQAWDAVALVRYPSRRAFTQMIADPEYAKANALRDSSVADVVLQPTISKS